MALREGVEERVSVCVCVCVRRGEFLAPWLNRKTNSGSVEEEKCFFFHSQTADVMPLRA